MILKCTSIDTETKLFTLGKYYNANFIYNGKFIQLFDDFGNAKVIASDDLTFPQGGDGCFVRFSKT